MYGDKRRQRVNNVGMTFSTSCPKWSREAVARPPNILKMFYQAETRHPVYVDHSYEREQRLDIGNFPVGIPQLTRWVVASPHSLVLTPFLEDFAARQFTHVKKSCLCCLQATIAHAPLWLGCQRPLTRDISGAAARSHGRLDSRRPCPSRRAPPVAPSCLPCNDRAQPATPRPLPTVACWWAWAVCLCLSQGARK